MSTGYALIDIKNPYYAQGQAVRRNGAKPSGLVVVHDSEGAADLVAPDTSLDGLISFLRSRKTPGCYHAANDSDSAQLIYPWSWETWQCTYTNNHSIGVAMVARVIDWPYMSPSFRTALMENNAKLAAQAIRWLRDERKIVVPIRWLSRSEALNRQPGLITHGRTASTEGTDPARRTDPFGRYWTRGVSTEYLQMVGDHVGSAVVVLPRPTGTFLPLVIDGDEGHKTVTEEQRAWKKLGDYTGIVEADIGQTAVRGPYLESAEQRFLKRIGWYAGAIDGDFGPMSCEAEQKWLQSIGLYALAINPNLRGEVVIRGLQSALNLGLIR